MVFERGLGALETGPTVKARTIFLVDFHPEASRAIVAEAIDEKFVREKGGRSPNIAQRAYSQYGGGNAESVHLNIESDRLQRSGRGQRLNERGGGILKFAKFFSHG